MSAEQSGERTAAQGEDAPPQRRRKRSPGAVRTAARVLQKEARKILKKHKTRIAAEPVEAILACLAAIDTHRNSDDYAALEDEAEKLDELLHQHASFARKSALRETLENIFIAILIALGLRSCFYEPFKIPSESMLPTLRSGDHIFVNKFAYGIQIPFTTTVVGDFLGEISRGDVIVFRYPLDESEDFIKRVMGLPGDVVRVEGGKVSIKRAGSDTFEELERTKIDQECYNQSGCQLYRETAHGRSYIVRYAAGGEDRGDARFRKVFTVPEGHVLVMGDNRNQSHDSLAWEVEIEAVNAESLVSLKDLRDLTTESQFQALRTEEPDGQGDPSHSRVTWEGKHRSLEHDAMLAVWRKPSLGGRVVFDAVGEGIEEAQATTVAELLEGRKKPTGPKREEVLEVGARIDSLLVARTATAFRALAYIEPLDTVLEFECGNRTCKNEGRLATRLVEIADRLLTNPDQDARQLLKQPKGVHYGTHWTGRSDIRDHFYERRFTDGAGARATVRLRAFRKPEEGPDLVRDMALRSLGSSRKEARRLPEISEDSWLVESQDSYGFVSADPVRDIVVVLECGKKRCKTFDEIINLGRRINSRMPKAAGDRRKLKLLLAQRDVEGYTEADIDHRSRHEYDRVRLEATVQGQEHSADVEVWLKPKGGLAAKLAELRQLAGLEPDDAVVQDGFAGEDDDAFTFAFANADTDVVVRIDCHRGLCPTRDDAIRMARRAAEKAANSSNFIDPNHKLARPFVPRGNVKGRAERIWLPLSRFWLQIK